MIPVHPARIARLVGGLALSALALSACGKKADPEAAAEADTPREERYNPVSEQTTPDGEILQQIDLDLADNRRPDLFNVLKPRPDGSRQILRKEVDANFDGEIDTITYYDDDEQIIREEADRDFDKRFDQRDHYRTGFLVLTETDTDGDGKMDTFCYYEGDDPAVAPTIARKERDMDNDGRIDFWEKFDRSGLVIRTGKDFDGDGKMDVRDE